MCSLFDSHAHYDDDAFDRDRDEVISALPGAGISGVINCGTDYNSSRLSLALSEKYSFVFAACGIHPHNAADVEPESIKEGLAPLLSAEKCVALGEIGLDYHYDFPPRKVQLDVFEEQLKIASRYNLPVIIHNREAHADTLRLLQEYRPKGVLHCFSGSAEMAAEAVKLGMYIGLGGAVTFKNARKPLEAAKSVPLERLLIETDCPYMAPVPLRGKRCDSTMLKFTAQRIAQERNITYESLCEATDRNARKLFGL